MKTVDQEICQQQLNRWISALALVTFDVDEGQKVQYLTPKLQLSQQSLRQLAMLSFPDSNSFNDYENSFKYTFRMYNGMFGYSCFKQKKDSKNSRGFSQKSFVILSQLPLIHLFQILCEFIVFKTFNTVSDQEFEGVMTRICKQISKWPDPTPKTSYILPILDYQLTLDIPNYTTPRKNMKKTDVGKFEHKKIQIFPMNGNQFNLKNILSQQQLSRQGPFQQIKLNQIFMNCNQALWAVWEKVMLNKSILLYGSNPQFISHAVLGAISLIYPFEYCGNYNPYVTVYDPHLNKMSAEERNWVLGGTNPVFSKFFSKDITEIITLDKNYKCPKHLVPLRQLLLKSQTQEQQAINQSAIRKYFYQLSKSVMAIIQDHLRHQPNDLKFFNQANFLKQVKERKQYFGFDQLFSSKKYIYQFFKQFITSSNFQLYLTNRNTIRMKIK